MAIRFETYLFDLDGTLIDSVELIFASYRHTMRVHRDTEPSDDIWLAGLGTPLSAQFRHFTDDPVEIEAMIATYRAYNHEHHDRMVRPYDGIVDAVGKVARHAQLGIVTSKSHEGAERGLRSCGLDGVFRTIVGSDDLTRHKPDPDPVEHALRLLAGTPETTVFVGDSPHDMAAGRAAGVRTAAALWGPFGRAHLLPHAPDYWLDAPPALTRLGHNS